MYRLSLLFVFCALCNSGWAQSQATPMDWYRFGDKTSKSTLPDTKDERLSGIDTSVTDASRVTLSTRLPGVGIYEKQLPDKNFWQAAYAPGCSFGEPGTPSVPVFSQMLLVPNGASVIVKVNPGEPRILNEIELAPVQAPLPDSYVMGTPQFVRDDAIYTSDAEFPGKFFEQLPTSEMRGQQQVQLWIYPYQYNPQTKTLKIYDQMQLDVSFKGGGEPIPANLKSENFEQLYRRMMPNADVVIALQEKIAKTRVLPQAAEKGNGSTGGCELLIICDPLFNAAAQDLADWKRMRGIKTKVVTTAITGSTTGEIKTYIEDSQAWSPAPEFVLLLGDAEYIPTFYETTHASDAYTVTDGGLIQGKIASDRYYGELTNDWSADLYVGRLPVDTAAEAQIVCDRIITYEKTPPDSVAHDDFYERIAVCAYFQDTDDGDTYADRRFAKTSEDIYQFLDSEGYAPERIYNTEAGTTPLYWSQDGRWIFENDTIGGDIPEYLKKPDFAWDGDRLDITSAIENGSFLVTHRDHGARILYSNPAGFWYEGGWEAPAYTESNAYHINNPGLPPVVWSMNCMTGWFDNETDPAGLPYYETDGTTTMNFYSKAADESIAEYFLLNDDGGAVGVIGASRVSYSGFNDRLTWGFMDAIWPGFIEYHSGDYDDVQGSYQMGPAFEYGRNYLLSKYFIFMANTQTAMDEFHWFGDPSMEIWTAAPESFNVQHRADMARGEYNTMTVTVKTNLLVAIKGARVTISRPEAPNDYWTALTDGAGEANFDGLTPTDLGDYDVIVTKHNYRPYVGTIESTSSSPYVTSITQDAPVNTNQQEVDFIVAFNETVNNVGAANFSLSTTGLSGAYIDSVFGFGAARVVRVNTGTGDGTAMILLDDPTGIVDNEGYSMAGAIYFSENYFIDKTAPDCTVTGPFDPTTDSPMTFSIEFTEAVTGLTTDDFSVINGSKDSLAGSGDGPYTLTVTPIAQGEVSCYVMASGATDDAGNGNNRSDAWTTTFDTVGPTVNLVCLDDEFTSQSPLAFELQVNEATNGLALEDFTIVNGAAQNLERWGLDYRFEIVPDAEGYVTAKLNAAGLHDMAGNNNDDESNRCIITYDTTPPVGTMQVVGDDCTSLSTVTIAITGNDLFSGDSLMMRLCKLGAPWDPWEPYTIYKTIELSDYDGVQTICLDLCDEAGNITVEVIRLEVERDTLAPQSTLTLPEGPVGTHQIAIEWEVLEEGAGVRQVKLEWDRNDDAWQSLALFEEATGTVDFNTALEGRGDGVYRFRMHATDLAGNTESEGDSGTVEVNAGPNAVQAGWALYY